jgi:hypothetical protein
MLNVYNILNNVLKDKPTIKKHCLGFHFLLRITLTMFKVCLPITELLPETKPNLMQRSNY